MLDRETDRAFSQINAAVAKQEAPLTNAQRRALFAHMKADLDKRLGGLPVEAEPKPAEEAGG